MKLSINQYITYHKDMLLLQLIKFTKKQKNNGSYYNGIAGIQGITGENQHDYQICLHTAKQDEGRTPRQLGGQLRNMYLPENQ